MVQMYDVWVLVATSSVPLGLVVCTEVLKHSGRMSAPQARKFLHIVTGLLFMLTWPLYTPDPSARFLAALLPGVMALRFTLAGLGITHEPRLIAGTARTGKRDELLGGPTLYGVSHAVLTVAAWRTSPAAAAGLAALCAGDGAAEIGGRRWGSHTGPLPYNNNKTWAGSCSCFVASFVAILSYLAWFNSLGYFRQRWPLGDLLLGSGVSAAAATLLESLPGSWDNIFLPAGAAITAWLVLH